MKSILNIQLLIAALVGFLSDAASATVTIYSNKTNWENAAGAYSTIYFNELPANTWIDEQYAYLGVHFTDGSDQIYESDAFVTDGFGLNGALDDSTLEFDAPLTSIAMDFPGIARIQLFFEGKLMYTSPELGLPGIGNFRGLISTEAFDSVKLYDPAFAGFFADNLYFGPPIPAPGVLALLGVATLFNGRHRRKRSAS
jgi:hypothetical protein